MSIHLTRATLLLEQRNYREAEKELTLALAEDPTHPGALRLLAIVKLDTGQDADGLSLAKKALQAAPSEGESHYIASYAYLRTGNLKEALARQQEAVQLDPTAPHYFALGASIALQRKQYGQAEQLANQALALDAENLQALNLRATAQRYQGNKKGAQDTLYRALEREPENSQSHANLGWAMLDQGQPKKALEHFREALRQNPDSQFAKSGLVESLKARYWVYRIFLAYYLWMEKQSGQVQVAVILGVVFLNRIISRMLETSPEWRPLLIPLLVLIIAFAFSTWVISPLFNLMLLLNPYGKYALTQEDRAAARLTGAGLSIGLLSGATYLWLSHQEGFMALALFSLLMMVPFSTLSKALPSKKLRLLRGLSVVLGSIGLLAVATAFMFNQASNIFSVGFLFGLIGFQFFTNFFIMRN